MIFIINKRMQKFLKYANIDKLPILELEDKNNPLVLISKGTNTISYRQRGAETEAVVRDNCYASPWEPQSP